jgi:2-hydroxy-6-oxonona-2,4-dienedioate hydrolase
MRTHAVDVERRPVPQQARRDALPEGAIASRAWLRAEVRDRRPAVLVHGLVVSSRYHVPLARHLARDRPVHAPDLPGFGHSDRPTQPLDTRELGHALASWMDARGLADVALIGNSYGCQVATETALARPDLAVRLVLLGPTLDRHARRLAAQLRRWRQEQRTQSTALQRILLRDYLRAGIPRAIATFRHAMADRIEDRLPFLEMPSLVCRGSRDPIVSERWATEVTDLLPDAQLRVLPGATHAINHEMPLQTARVVEHFLAGRP